MVEKSGVERSGVEAWGWKAQGWNVLQPENKCVPPKYEDDQGAGVFFKQVLLETKFGKDHRLIVLQKNLQASQVKREDGLPEDYGNWTVMTNLLDAERKYEKDY